MASRVTDLVRAATEVTRKLAGGDLTGRVTVDNVRGETLHLKNSINDMAEHLHSVIGEANRKLKEIQEGSLHDPPVNVGASGAWKVSIDAVFNPIYRTKPPMMTTRHFLTTWMRVVLFRCPLKEGRSFALEVGSFLGS